jgi:hypothetical protein
MSLRDIEIKLKPGAYGGKGAVIIRTRVTTDGLCRAVACRTDPERAKPPEKGCLL